MEWFQYGEKELKDPEKQKEVFEHLLRKLEERGHCMYVYHALAKVLFDDDMRH